MSNEENIEELRKSILSGDEEAAKKAAKKILEADLDPLKVIEVHLAPTMKTVGEKFENGEFFLTDLMLSAEAMKSATEILSLKIGKLKSETKKNGKIVLGTVSGDIHDIGKNILSLLLEINGFELNDLGVDVEPMKFIEEAEKMNADVIAISALMSTTRSLQKEILELLKGFNKRENYLVVVGGGATTNKWAEEIGADGWTETAVEAPEMIKKLLNK